MKKRTLKIATVVAILLGIALMAVVGVLNNGKKYQNMADVFEPAAGVEPSPLTGKGTKNDPYLVGSYEELCSFRDHVNSGYAYEFEYVLQTEDIDLGADDNWTPIGIYESQNYFEGYYDGGGHTVSNLNVKGDMEADLPSNGALFGQLGGTVINLGIESGRVEGDCVGSIASHSAGATARIINCYNKATVIGGRAGGIVDNFNAGAIYNCVNMGEIEAFERGGVIGYTGTVTDCFSTLYEPAPTTFIGFMGQSSKELSAGGYDAQRVCDVLNSRLDGIAVNHIENMQLYRWQVVDGELTFGEKDTNLYPLYFSISAILALGLLLVVNVLFITRKKNMLQPITDTGIVARFKYAHSAVTSDRATAMRYAFAAAIQVAWCFVIVGVLCGNRNMLFGFTFNNGRDLFMDFFNPLSTMNKGTYWFSHLYEADTYPPFANLLFFIFSRFIPESGHMASAELRISFAGMIFFVLAFFCVYVLYELCRKKIGKKPHALLMALGLAFCSPILFNVERGNIILLSLLFTACFLFGYDSENKIVRELSLICLAMAASIKIYPAVFGFILVWDKRYMQAVRCAIYGVVCFLAPFALFGGFSGFEGFLSNLTEFVGGNAAAARDHLMNFSNLLSNLTQLFLGSAELGRSIAGYALVPFSLLTVLLATFVFKSRWKSVLALSMVLVLFPNANGYYAMSFYIFPIVFFLIEEKHGIFDWFYLAFMSLCILPMQFLMGLFGINSGTLWQICATAQAALIVAIIVDGAVTLIKRIKQRKAKGDLAAV